uniref:chitin synthase n=1 Tax=Periophthalmus magnuspinnatus TaxID=409849 RepID=A0A3B4BHV9_9GOBI
MLQKLFYFFRRLWDTFQEIPIIEDEQTPWKLIKLVRFISMCVVALVVFGLALCSTKVIPDEQKPVALLCIGCALITSSVLFFLKSIWKACYKTSKFPRAATIALLMASAGGAILTIVAMPHLDIVTNVTILNGAAFLSALLQMVAQCKAKETNRFLVPSIVGLVLIILGYALFVALYIMKDLTDLKMATWVGLAVGASLLVSFNWWENYFGLISEHSSSLVVKRLYYDMKRCQNVLNMLSCLLRIAVIASVVGAYVPLSQMDWDVVRSIPGPQTRVIAITVGVQLISSALCHWFSLAACKMHAMRRCFILPLYLASLSVMALLYRLSLNGTSTNFTHYCSVVVGARDGNLSSSVFPELRCFSSCTVLSLSVCFSSGSAVSWWLGLVLCTVHLWHLSLYRIQRTQDLFVRRMYEGGFIEQSLLLNTRFEIKISPKMKQFTPLEPVKLFLCATMWHETYSEMMKIIISIFRLDQYRPKRDEKKVDLSFEAHVYFDDAFVDVPGSQGRHVNEYAEMLVNILREVYKKQQVPDQKVFRTPYGGRLVMTMPHGNNITIHFKDKKLIRHKKRWSQVMYMYYLLGWKVATRYYKASLNIHYCIKEKHNTYVLALDGDTDFHPAAVLLLVDRLKLYPKVGAVCGRIHPTGSGPMVWYQKFEYGVGHWLQKTAEHVFGSVLCSPGCFSLFRSSAIMDENVMKRYTVKATKASHHLQYDQGEDRWLCTLMMKQGWRVEYNAAADAYTNAPEEFKEFYNQRRRWGPSTFVNSVDLLGSATMMIRRNHSISRLYLVYQLISLATSILSPSSVILMITGSFNLLLGIPQNDALILAIIPPIIYLAVSYKVKADTQVTIAAVMSCFYAFLMMIVFMTIVGNMVKERSIMNPSSLFIILLMAFYVITALLHPQEVGLIMHGFLYLLCIPSAYLLLSIYSLVNMNSVSWGTRETAPAPGTAQPAASAPALSPVQKGEIWFSQSHILSSDEEQFFQELIVRYLEPVNLDKQQQQEMMDGLRSLRNKGNFVYFMINALWLVATFALQYRSDLVGIRIPKVNINLEETGEYMLIEPVGIMFILAFALLVFIQFIAMLWHRLYTLIHYISFLDTETEKLEIPKMDPKMETFEALKKVFI